MSALRKAKKIESRSFKIIFKVKFAGANTTSKIKIKEYKKFVEMAKMIEYKCGISSENLGNGKCIGKHTVNTEDNKSEKGIIMGHCSVCPAYSAELHEKFYHEQEKWWDEKNRGDGLTEFDRVRRPEYLKCEGISLSEFIH